jgi:hypothetical protein
VQLKLISLSLIYNVTFSEFNENDLMNWKNNVLVNSLFNSLSNINSFSMLFSSVFLHHRFKQHLDSVNVFSLFLFLSSNSSHIPIVDFPYTDTEFEKFLLNFTYRTSSSSPSSLNISTNSSTFSKEFVVFHKLFLHVFSFSSSHYYSTLTS